MFFHLVINGPPVVALSPPSDAPQFENHCMTGNIGERFVFEFQSDPDSAEEASKSTSVLSV